MPHIGLDFEINILDLAYDPLSKQKAPKVLADALTWVDQALIEFGIAGLSLRSLIEFLKTTLKNSNAAVRTNATKTIVTVKLFAGSSKYKRRVPVTTILKRSSH